MINDKSIYNLHGVKCVVSLTVLFDKNYKVIRDKICTRKNRSNPLKFQTFNGLLNFQIISSPTITIT